eukprot:5334595-Pyramimonas_sp.AAC.1
MVSEADPMQVAWVPIQIPEGLHGFGCRSETDCKRPHKDLIRIESGSIQVTHRLYGIHSRPHTDCMGPDT